jgi:hypothetical protein
LLRIANTPGNVDDGLDKIRQFVSAARGMRVPREAIYHIDSVAKEERRVEFFTSVKKKD